MSVSEPKDYLTTTTDLTNIANIIRTKFNVSGSLVYPSEYINHINNVQMYDISGYLQGTLSTFEDSNISSVGSYAFAGCSSLTEVSLPNCSTISFRAFDSCYQLTNVYCPSCGSIGTGTFAYCTQLSSVTLNNSSITTIPIEAFSHCYSLTSISFPNCTYIEYYAFTSCSNLASVDFPLCSFISRHAFVDCISLSIASFPQCSYIGQSAFAGCSNLTAISIPNCSLVSSGTFRNCYNLTWAEIPNCSYVGSSAFQNCSALSYIDILYCSSLYSYAFVGCWNLETIHLENIASLYISTFYSCYNLTYVYLDNYSSSTHIVPLANASVFSYTPMAGYSASTSLYGKIYVNDMDYSIYISSTNWTYYSDHIFPVGANLYSTSAVYLSRSLSIPSYMESFSTSSFSFANSIGSVFNSFRISSYSQVYYDNYLVYDDGYWNDDTGQEITFQTDSSNAYPPEFVKWFYSNQSTSGGDGGGDGDGLYNTTWTFNSTLKEPDFIGEEGYVIFDITFTFNNDSETCIGLLLDITNGFVMVEYLRESDVITAYNQNGSGAWEDNILKTIHILNGTDATNSDLINYLNDNAEKQEI